VEIEAELEKGGQKFVEELAARARGVKR